MRCIELRGKANLLADIKKWSIFNYFQQSSLEHFLAYLHMVSDSERKNLACYPSIFEWSFCSRPRIEDCVVSIYTP